MTQLDTVIPAIFNRIRQSASFMAIRGYHDNHDGIADYGIVFHVNYIKAVKKSLQAIQSFGPKSELELIAKNDLIESFKDTLAGYNPRAKSAHAYDLISYGDKTIKGVKYHVKGEAVHLWGFIVHKKIIKEAVYPNHNRSDLSRIRNYLRGQTPVSRFRQFKIAHGRFESINIEKLNLTQKDLIKSINTMV